ncbi:MAG: hypothetical protein WB797_16505 [Nocardioides sp.]
MDPTRIRDVLGSDSTPLIRTDFSDDAAWQTVVSEVSKPVDLDPENAASGENGYAPDLTLIDDRAFEGVTGAALGADLDVVEDACGYALLADDRSMAEALAGGELTLDYVDLSITDPDDAELFNSYLGRSFRCVVPEIASIDANLSIANLDFSDFADNTDPDGVFRGFEGDS